MATKREFNKLTNYPNTVNSIKNALGISGIEAVINNQGNISIRKIYSSIAAMNADAAAPVDSNGIAILSGQLVAVSNDSDPAEMGRVYRWYNGESWEYAGKIGDLSQKADALAVVPRNGIGGNLLDQETLLDGWIDSGGNINVSSSYGHTNFIPISEGETLVSNISAGTNPQIALYDSDFNFLSSVNSSVKQITGTSASKYVAWSVQYSALSYASAIYKGTLPATIEPYNPVYGYIEGLKTFDKTNGILIQSKYNISSDLTLVATTYTVGIFGDTAQTSYHTSDFIQITPKENLNYYISFGNAMNSSFSLMRFYDKDQVEIDRILGNSADRPKTIGLTYQINFPSNTKYVKYSTKIDQPNTGLFSAPPKTLEQCIESILSGSKGTVLWLGTSIPEGAEYPVKSCEKVGYDCINNSRGASGIIFTPIAPSPPINSVAGFSLTATVAEKEAKWRPLVNSGDITEAQLDIWKTYSYENLVLPYLDSVDAIVIDHGYNDRYNLPAVVAAGEGAIDWSSNDRTTFLGALRYLIDEILIRKPFMKILIGGYFQNKVDLDGRNGSHVCTVLEWAASHYNMPLLDAWNYSGIGNLYVLDTGTYIADFNTAHGTSYTKFHADGNGNIMTFQLFCPDSVHPHSDLTGNSNKRLNAVFAKLLRDTLI